MNIGEGFARPSVDLGFLAGPEGNVHCVLGRCAKAMRDAGWPKEHQDAWEAEAKADKTYEGILKTIPKYFNARANGRRMGSPKTR